MRLIIMSLCLTLTLSAVSGCGIKPSEIDPPAGTEKDYFPKTYPDHSTDPHPERYMRP
ncbi:MAG: hypothetical protein KAI61_02015 [Alphaproteobacteria bacterium]|nr:hypothetical protein [Alphaproteobacteria bacterium]MCK5556529.1 hypothetical protein [Alphaproteobacteria bacterium]